MNKSFKSKNKHLESLANKYYINYGNLESPEIRTYSYKDLIGIFDSSLEEYAKVISKKMELYESKTTRELLKLHNIKYSELLELKQFINNHLSKHTDIKINNSKKIELVFNQIDTFLDTAKRTILDIKDSDLNFSENKLTKVFYSSNVIEKNNYLNKVVELMKDAEVNQIHNNKYLVLEKIFNENLKLIKLYGYINSPKSFNKLQELQLKFKEMKKYLKSKKDDVSKAKTLTKYQNELSNEYMYLFVWYVIYDMKKIHIYQINSIIGYTNNSLVKLYNHIFQLDHSTGRNKTFIHHTQIKTDTLSLYYLLKNYLT